jgi:hypothetical protein
MVGSMGGGTGTGTRGNNAERCSCCWGIQRPGRRQGRTVPPPHSHCHRQRRRRGRGRGSTGGDDHGRQGGGGGGITVPCRARRPFVRPCLGRGSGGHGGGRPSRRRANGGAVPDSWAQAGGAGGRRRWRQAQQSPDAVAPQVRRRPPCPAARTGQR